MPKIEEISISDNVAEHYVNNFEVHCDAGDQIKFITKRNAASTISIPDAMTFLEGKKREDYIQDFIPEMSSKTYKVKKDPEKGDHYYQVFMVVQQDFADKPGSSAPKIVID
jgi:hypothetical protein